MLNGRQEGEAKVIVGFADAELVIFESCSMAGLELNQCTSVIRPGKRILEDLFLEELH